MWRAITSRPLRCGRRYARIALCRWKRLGRLRGPCWFWRRTPLWKDGEVTHGPPLFGNCCAAWAGPRAAALCLRKFRKCWYVSVWSLLLLKSKLIRLNLRTGRSLVQASFVSRTELWSFEARSLVKAFESSDVFLDFAHRRCLCLSDNLGFHIVLPWYVFANG